MSTPTASSEARASRQDRDGHSGNKAGRIVVVGGVAGGMSCAARARRLDEAAEIIVLERGAHVSFANCGLPYHVGGEIVTAERLLVQTPESLRATLNLDVRTGHDVTAVDTANRTITVHSSRRDTVVL